MKIVLFAAVLVITQIAVLNDPAPLGVLLATFGDTIRLSPNSTTPFALMVVICMGPKIFAGIGRHPSI
jgi:hypothetical protein